MKFRPKKYTCSICGKGFRRTKQHYNHVMRNSCGKNRGTNKKQVIIEPIIEQELVSLKPEIIHSEPSIYENQYYGRLYNYINIPTGNRHYRAGVYSNVRLSSYRSQAI